MAQAPQPEIADQARTFSDWNELGRRNIAARRVVPTHQSLKPEHTARREVNLGLVVHREPNVLADSGAQVADKRSLVLDGSKHVGLEEHETAPPLRLGLVQSQVGVA